MKKSTILVLLVLAGIAAILGWVFYSTPKDASADYRSAAYTLDGKPITMTSPGIQYFGNEAYGDIDGDGQQDVVFLFTYDGGGSGLFYYAAAALKTEDGYKGTNAFFVGDRIAPQNNRIQEVEIHGIHSAEININFAQRRPGEPFTAKPSQGAVLLLKVTKEGVLEGLMK